MKVKDWSRSESKIFILQFQRLFAARCSGKHLVDAISSVSAYSTQWKDPLFSTALDPSPAVPPRRASSQPQHAQCSTQSGLAPWRFALQPIALGGMESTGTALNVHYKQKKPNWQGISQAKSSLHFTMPYRLGCFEVLGVGQNFAPINVRSMRFTPHFSGTLIYIMASVFLKMPPISLDSLFFYLVITFQLRKTKLVEIQE